MCLGRGAWLCPFSIGNSHWLSDSFVIKSSLPALARTFPLLLFSCTFIPYWSSFCARRSPAFSHLRSSSHQKSSFNIPTLASLSLSLNLLLDTIRWIPLPSPVFSRWALHVCPPSRYQGSWSFCLCTDILYQPIPERNQSSGNTSPLYRTVPPGL